MRKLILFLMLLIFCPNLMGQINQNFGSGAVTSLTNITNINGIVYIDGVTFAKTGTGVNAALDSFGAAPACGTIMLPYGELDTTVTIGGSHTAGRYGCVFIGQGASQGTSSKGTYIKWTGAANGTVFDLHSCYNCYLAHASIDGASSAGVGLAVSSIMADGPSITNSATDMLIENVTGTPGYGVFTGDATNFEVQSAAFDQFLVLNTKTALFHQAGNNTMSTYKNFTVTGYTVSCMDLNSGTAIAINYGCGSATLGATGMVIIENTFTSFQVTALNLEGSNNVPALVMSDGSVGTHGPSVSIVGSAIQSGTGGSSLNYTQNGQLTIIGTQFTGATNTVTINPAGSVASGFIGLVKLQGNQWNSTVITTSGVNYEVDSQDGTTGAAFYTGAGAPTGSNPLHVIDAVTLDLINGSQLAFTNATNKWDWFQNGGQLKLQRDAGIAAQFFLGSTAAMDGSTDFDVPQLVANQLNFGDQTASNVSLFHSGLTLQVRNGTNAADEPITASNGTFSGIVSGTTYKTATNCAANGTAANPSVVACGSAAAGMFSCATNATTTTCQINTTAVTANSEIQINQDSADGGASQLNVTCEVTNSLPTTKPLLLSKSAGANFILNMGTITTNPACFEYTITN